MCRCFVYNGKRFYGRPRTCNYPGDHGRGIQSVILGFELNSFCKAIVQGDYEAVKKMIELGEDINQKSLGKTPAIYAARYNKVEILKLLDRQWCRPESQMR